MARIHWVFPIRRELDEVSKRRARCGGRHVLAMPLFDSRVLIADHERTMAVYKIQIPDKPLAVIRFEIDNVYPGWYVHCMRKGKMRKYALRARSQVNPGEAVAEASEFLECAPDRIEIDQAHDVGGIHSVGTHSPGPSRPNPSWAE